MDGVEKFAPKLQQKCETTKLSAQKVAVYLRVVIFEKLIWIDARSARKALRVPCPAPRLYLGIYRRFLPLLYRGLSPRR